MSVVGIDLGNQSAYIAVARQGGIETVTNDYSLRATPTCASFGGKTRQIGVSGRQQLLTNVKNTIIYFKHLIGRRFDDRIVQEERKWLNYELVELPDRRLGIKLMHLGETRMMTPEQILAVLLVKLRKIAEVYLKATVSDCVLAVPCYWTDSQRRALLDAAKISELNCLRLINETTAVALNYGIYKDLPAENEKPRHVVFLDIGYSSTQVCVVAFNKGKLKILNAVWDINLGGREYDNVIRDYFSREFMKKYKLDASTNPRAWIRLLDECEKVKKQMSANQNSIPLNIECFMNDKDVEAMIKRADFENMCGHLWQRVEALLHRAVSDIKMRASDVDVIEMVGGGTRMPMIRAIIQKVFGKDPQTTLNQDEAVSRGCALQCAMLSPAFRVREFDITDCQPYSIKLSWSSGDGGEMEVFPERQTYPFTKMLTFYRKEPFTLEAAYSYPNHVPFPTTRIGQFGINNVVPGPDGDSSKVKVKVRLNPSGILTVVSASMYERQQQTEDEQPEAMETDAGDQTNANGPAQDTPSEPMQTEQQSTDPLQPGESQKTTKQKVKVKSIDLPIIAQVPEMHPNEIAKFVSIEHEMYNCDMMELEKADARNALEEYAYEMRDKLSEQYRDFVTPVDADNMRRQLEAVENWLYEEGDDQPKQVYCDKLQSFKKLGDPIVERYHEAQERPVAFEELGRILQLARKFYEKYYSQDEAYNHIEQAEAEKVLKMLNEKQAWFDQQQNAQNRRPLTEPPVVFASQIRAEKEAFERVVLPVINKPKPKKEPPPAPKAPEENNGQETKKSQEENMDTDR